MSADQESPESQEQEQSQKDVVIHCRFVKMTNGDDIICQIPQGIETDTILFVINPMRVIEMFEPEEEDSTFMLAPWIPFTGQEMVAVNKLNVVAITSILPQIETMYLHRIAELMNDTIRRMDFDEDEDEMPERNICTHNKDWVN
jgi:hypothetical protein